MRLADTFNSARAGLNYWDVEERSYVGFREAASPWPGADIIVLSWEPMKECLPAPLFF